MATAALAEQRVPGEATAAFAAAINEGNLAAAANCFAKDACLLTPDATAIRGREEIRPVLHQLIVFGFRIEVQESSVLLAGDVALGSERWLITSAGASGSPFSRLLTPTVVLRRLERVWKLAVAMPWGRR
ncbi:MAG: YybH family protein [Methanosarcina sp.]